MIVPGFSVGDRVRVIDEPNGPVSGLIPPEGTEYVIPANAADLFDRKDDSWFLGGCWVYESSLELIAPALTDNEVAEAIASIKGGPQ